MDFTAFANFLTNINLLTQNPLTWAVIVGLAYVAGMVIVRQHFVGDSLRRSLNGEIESLCQSLTADKALVSAQDKPANEILNEIDRLLDSAEKCVKTDLNPWWRRWVEYIFWNGAKETESWKLLHDAQQLRALLYSQETVGAQLRRTRYELAKLDDSDAKIWKDMVESYFDAKGKFVTDPSVAQAKADLGSVMAFLYDREDTRMGQLINLLNKVMWVILIGLLLIGLILFNQPTYLPILLAGTVGALISRIIRLYRGDQIETSYGLSWAPIFLSPIVGALTAWGGILLIQIGHKLGVLSLEPLFPTATQSTSSASILDMSSPIVIGIAVLFGFSEQLFDSISSLLGNRLSSSAASNPPASSNNSLAISGPGGEGQQNTQTADKAAADKSAADKAAADKAAADKAAADKAAAVTPPADAPLPESK